MKRRRKKRRNWFAPIALLFVVASVLWIPQQAKRVLPHLPFTVRQLTVGGMEMLSALDLKVLAGIEKGTPLFGDSINKVAEKIQQHPRVSRVTVVRDIAGRVRIQVAERKPKALVHLESLYFLDENGNVMEPAHMHFQKADDLPVMTGPWSQDGRRPADGVVWKQKWISGVKLIETLNHHGIHNAHISEVHYEQRLGWVVYRMGSLAPIVFGENQFERKARRLSRVLQDMQTRAGVIREIDLDWKDRVVVKTRNTG